MAGQSPCGACGRKNWVALPPTRAGYRRLACAGTGTKADLKGPDGEGLQCGRSVAF